MRERSKFIEELVMKPRPLGVLLEPWKRSLLYCLGVSVFCVLLMLWVQPFRNGFWLEVLHYPRFLLELATGLFFCVMGFYFLFKKSVPGEAVATPLLVGMGVAFFGFLLALVFGFVVVSPPFSGIGARPFCSGEVLLYGNLSMGVLWFFMRYGRIHRGLYALFYGLLAGLLPALLMQLGCLYDPTHAVVHHYGPVLVLSLISTVFLSKA